MKKELNVTQKENHYRTLKCFKESLDDNITSNIDKIVTNCYLSSVFMDIVDDFKYRDEKIINTKGENYIIGTYKDIPIEVDINMSIHDSKMLFFDNNNELLELVINDPDMILI